MSILEIRQLTKNFGGIAAVVDVDMVVEKGDLVGLIGPNGAGKTTLFNLITGVYAPTSGEIVFTPYNKAILLSGKKPWWITRQGFARTFQNIRLFKELSVLDNVRIAMHKDIKYGVFSSILRLPAYYKEEDRVFTKALELLDIVGLKEKQAELAKNLPYGQQRRLEIARALATDPTVLFLDEPAAGMNPQETADLTRLIGELRQRFGLTIILIEHDMSLVMNLCERIYVLDYGRLIAKGSPDEIKNNQKVIEAYLGEEV
ncbi:MAG: ABC transporter ATP-binding protein [Erysipelotrichaceae bacterium]|jgi:branched-chain amino acid transport system ATP-binding protein|nr:ABC transporter ATP-binding protein [Erysipelotrichaceae bacterium]